MARGSCPSCARWYEYDLRFVGRRCRCDTCGAVFGVGHAVTRQWNRGQENRGITRTVTPARSQIAPDEHRSTRRVLSSVAERDSCQHDSRLTEPATKIAWWHWVVVGVLTVRVASCAFSGSSNTRSRSFPPFAGDHRVESYERRDGTRVREHWRTNPDSTELNNYSGPYGEYYRNISGHR